MFLITVTYIQSIDVVEQHLVAHRNFLEEGYQKDYFVVSGPQNPRTGGVIISQLNNRNELMKIIEQDPFYKNKIAEYNVIEFDPVKYHKDFTPFIIK